MKTTTEIAQESISSERLGVVACYFNPCNYLSKFINFLDFYFKVKATDNIDIIIVEAYSNSSIYSLKNSISNNLISIKSESVYWQKEELINMGMRKHIASGINKLCWLDGDIEFQNKNWSSNILEDLNQQDVVQVFSESNIIDSNNFKMTTSESYVKQLISNNTHPLHRKGEIGYGYAYNSEILTTDLLYINAVVGGGDFLNILPFVNDITTEQIKNDRYFKNANKHIIGDYLTWYNKTKKENIKLAYSDNKIRVAFHGDRKYRNYIKREKILKELNFNPYTDIVSEEFGELREIKNDKLKVYLIRYFNERKEDFFLENSNSRKFFNKIIARVLKMSGVKITTNDSILQKIDKLKSLKQKKRTNNKITTTNKNRVAVWSKNQIKEIKTKTLKNVEDFIFDKSDRMQNDAIENQKGERYLHTYLKYIIDNYDNLTNITIFLNDHVDQSHILEKKYLLDTIPNNENQKYTKVLGKYKKIKIDKCGHLIGLYKNTNITRSKYNFQEWLRIYTNNKDVPNNYEEYPIFYIGKNTIKLNCRDYYKRILELISVTSCITEDELYLQRSWSLLFK